VDYARVARHLFALPGAVGRAFPPAALANIEKAIARAEAGHRGEIRFAAEAALESAALLHEQSGRERAVQVFSLLRVWDTEENNGVLIYLLLADRDVEIVADRGFNGKVSAEEWESVCRRMESALREGRHADAVIDGVQSLSAIVARHFPPRPGGRNELPDTPASL